MPLLERTAERPGALRPETAFEPLRGREMVRAGSPAPSAARAEKPRRSWFPVCAHPGCTAGWLRVWRSRSHPVFEGGWCCSPQCTRALVEMAVRREMGAPVPAPEAHRHRIPLGLAMLDRRWITAGELRLALAAQREAGAGRLGHWLRRQGVSQRLITRALGLQWSCPVLSLEAEFDGFLSPLLPRLFVDAFGALPLRLAAEKVLYLGFEDRLDPALALAIERMTGLQVESGLVDESEFRRAHDRALEARYPAAELVEAASDAALAAALASAVEQAQPVESRLVRVHDCLWLRMWLHAQSGPVPACRAVRDLIGSPLPVRAAAGGRGAHPH